VQISGTGSEHNRLAVNREARGLDQLGIAIMFH
jgi:hypothetical protein